MSEHSEDEITLIQRRHDTLSMFPLIKYRGVLYTNLPDSQDREAAEREKLPLVEIGGMIAGEIRKHMHFAEPEKAIAVLTGLRLEGKI